MKKKLGKGGKVKVEVCGGQAGKSRESKGM